jgi:hypothetical protein
MKLYQYLNLNALTIIKSFFTSLSNNQIGWWPGLEQPGTCQYYLPGQQRAPGRPSMPTRRARRLVHRQVRRPMPSSQRLDLWLVCRCVLQQALRASAVMYSLLSSDPVRLICSGDRNGRGWGFPSFLLLSSVFLGESWLSIWAGELEDQLS